MFTLNDFEDFDGNKSSRVVKFVKLLIDITFHEQLCNFEKSTKLVNRKGLVICVNPESYVGGLVGGVPCWLVQVARVSLM